MSFRLTFMWDIYIYIHTQEGRSTSLWTLFFIKKNVLCVICFLKTGGRLSHLDKMVWLGRNIWLLKGNTDFWQSMFWYRFWHQCLHCIDRYIYHIKTKKLKSFLLTFWNECGATVTMPFHWISNPSAWIFSNKLLIQGL